MVARRTLLRGLTLGTGVMITGCTDTTAGTVPVEIGVINNRMDGEPRTVSIEIEDGDERSVFSQELEVESTHAGDSRDDGWFPSTTVAGTFVGGTEYRMAVSVLDGDYNDDESTTVTVDCPPDDGSSRDSWVARLRSGGGVLIHDADVCE